jgi:ATP adenylyltransferase/5',5'''-P-1,P-4-tetraphosphate phosphorylase II
MEFRICPALMKKPHTVGTSNPTFNHTSKWGPGSDMFIPDLRMIICQINSTHDLALNLFCVDRPQLLMVTSDSYRRQHEPLDAQDFAAMLHVLRRLEDWYFIFNCGEKGGCSRVHKHVQGLRGPPHAFEKLVQTSDGREEVPFKFFLKRFEKGFKAMEVAELLSAYNDMLARCKETLEVGDGELCPHNLVLWDDSIVVIPRRAGMWNGASANTGGMMGSVWVPEVAEMDKWLQLGPANVLRELGTPS